MFHPDSLLDVANLQHQDRLREVEVWQLARQARRNRAVFWGRLLHHLLSLVKKQLKVQAQPDSVTPNLADLYR